MTDQDLARLTGLFKLLSDKTRLHILMLLAGGEQNVSGLCEQLGLRQPTVSHHLGLLRLNHVIASHRKGKHVFYALERGVDMGIAGTMSISANDVRVEIASNR